MKFNFLVFLLLACTTLQAQNLNEEEYKRTAAEIQKEIFETPDANFDTNIIPEIYENESGIILAKKMFYVMTRKSKLNVSLFASVSQQCKFTTTNRQKVKINDKAALEEFSSIQYSKSTNKDAGGISSAVFGKFRENSKSFVGVKIIKPNGKEIIVDTNEEVLTKDEKKRKEGKLAISNLEVGDIIDFYIRTIEVMDDNLDVIGPFYFALGAEYPILSLDIKFELDKRAGVACRSNNGAPNFEQKINEEGNFEFTLVQKNLPKIKGQMWQHSLRQIPYAMLSYRAITGGSGSIPHLKGKVTSVFPFEQYLYTLTFDIAHSKNKEGEENTTSLFREAIKKASGKNYKDLQKDSLEMLIFNFWQYKWGYHYYGNDRKRKFDCGINGMHYLNLQRLLILHSVLEDLNVEHEFVITTADYAPKKEEILYEDGYDILIRTKGTKPIYFHTDNRFMHPFEIPARYQGQKAVVINAKDFNGNKTKPANMQEQILPKSTYEENVTKEKIDVVFDFTNSTPFTMNRQVSTRGYYKPSTQINFCLPEETDKLDAAVLGLKDVVAELQSNKKTLNDADMFIQGFKEAKEKWNEQFKTEFKDQFGVEAKEITNYKIDNYGLRYWEKDFVFSANYTIEDWLKNAGNNYLFEVGKLMGKFTKVNNKERIRTLDIFMPCARSFEFQFNIKIPKGYIAKGLDALNKNVNNEAAMFYSTATVNADIVTITVKRVYKNGFEPVTNWDKLLQAMDAAYDFTNSKLLLEKQK